MQFCGSITIEFRLVVYRACCGVINIVCYFWECVDFSYML